MDLVDELENMAVSATYEQTEEIAGSSDPKQLGTIKTWQERFDYTYDQAAELIRISRTAQKSPTAAQEVILSPVQARTICILKLDGPLSTLQKVLSAANLSRVPETYHSSSVAGSAVFCKVDGLAKRTIETWLSRQKEPSIRCFRPLFILEGSAYKELSAHSLYPTLGKDATLPQYRPQDAHLLITAPSFGRMDGLFPVRYFFYGTLASVPRLCGLLSLEEGEMPVLYEARVRGGRMERWGMGRYNALVDGAEMSCVKGLAYQVMTEEHEDVLRRYETSAYEVVRCLIEMDDAVVEGCTFRFVGDTD